MIPSETKKKQKKTTPCESCAYYDVIDEAGTLGCTIDVDEDELYRERQGGRGGCPYYKFYDEYKSVRRQN
jgi:hypothetical protein